MIIAPTLAVESEFLSRVFEIVRRREGHLHRVQHLRNGALRLHATTPSGIRTSLELRAMSGAYMAAARSGSPLTPGDAARLLLESWKSPQVEIPVDPPVEIPVDPLEKFPSSSTINSLCADAAESRCDRATPSACGTTRATCGPTSSTLGVRAGAACETLLFDGSDGFSRGEIR